MVTTKLKNKIKNYCYFKTKLLFLRVRNITPPLILSELPQAICNEGQKKNLCVLISCLLYSSSIFTDSLEQANKLLNTGNLYVLNHDFESAVSTYKKIISLYPRSAVAHYNLGYALNELTEYQAAAQAFEQACSTQPTAHNYVAWATALLATGDYEKGWKLYEHRWDLDDKKNVKMPCPRWDGVVSLKQKKIILLSEGALGDCIQFIRYAESIKKMDAYVIVLVPPALVTLASLCPFIDQIISSSDHMPAADYYTSLMSLPALLSTTQKNVPATIPYLNVDIPLFNYWHEMLSGEKRFKVGICWQADPSNDANRPPMARRSIAPKIFKPLSRLPQIALYSLHQNQQSPDFMHNFGPTIDTTHGRFMDTAAIICNLDLVITVDTSIAHLAGALGVPTWLILPYKSDWRWMTDCTHTPWYPTMYIFRASKNESWQTIIETIADTLSFSLTSHQG